MKVFVTVGTTSFDSMIKRIDEYFFGRKDYEVTFQMADGKYKPRSGEYFGFTDDIQSYYINSDLIITHSGAGTIYSLVEQRKKIIAVPNLERIDKHQSDLACYMEKFGYLLVWWDYINFEDLMKRIETFVPNEYQKIPFNKYDAIADYINSLP